MTKMMARQKLTNLSTVLALNEKVLLGTALNPCLRRPAQLPADHDVKHQHQFTVSSIQSLASDP